MASPLCRMAPNEKKKKKKKRSVCSHKLQRPKRTMMAINNPEQNRDANCGLVSINGLAGCSVLKPRRYKGTELGTGSKKLARIRDAMMENDGWGKQRGICSIRLPRMYIRPALQEISHLCEVRGTWGMRCDARVPVATQLIQRVCFVIFRVVRVAPRHSATLFFFFFFE